MPTDNIHALREPVEPAPAVRRRQSAQLLTPEQVADRLAISRSSVRRMMIEGQLPAIVLRSGKRKKVFRIREEALERWLQGKERESHRATKATLAVGGEQ